MKKSFLDAKEPFIMEMVQVPTDVLAKAKIKKAIQGGATAIGFQMSFFGKEYRNEKTLSDIFALAEDKPIYFTNYRDRVNQGMTDDELMDGLLFGFKCGATMVDVMGDTFCPEKEELTTDEKAIKKPPYGGFFYFSHRLRAFGRSDRASRACAGR